MHLGLSVLLLALWGDVSACALDTGRHSVQAFPASISAPRDIPVGGVIFDTHGWIGTGEAYVRCMELGSHHVSTGFISSPAAVSGLSGVYATSLEGIGVRVAWAQNANNLPASIEGGEIMHGSRPRRAIPRNHYAPAQRFWVQLVKTNDNPSSGALQINPVRIYYDNELTNELTFPPTQLMFTQKGCRLRTPNTTVQLPFANLHHFRGVGSGTRPKAFNLELECDPDVRVSYRVDGLQAADSVLKNGEGSGMAKGVGVQLLKGEGSGMPLVLGTKTYHLSSGATGGPSVIPLIARYYQVGPTVSPGEVITIATLTLFYE
ncbi:fimbrial protein [Pseudomonas tohonis]|uniref:fimbrial protein n=1 Tax=Pseudomonas tohonis TaxID=2725477 RepID=UPI003A5BF025